MSTKARSITFALLAAKRNLMLNLKSMLEGTGHANPRDAGFKSKSLFFMTFLDNLDRETGITLINR